MVRREHPLVDAPLSAVLPVLIWLNQFKVGKWCINTTSTYCCCCCKSKRKKHASEGPVEDSANEEETSEDMSSSEITLNASNRERKDEPHKNSWAREDQFRRALRNYNSEPTDEAVERVIKAAGRLKDLSIKERGTVVSAGDFLGDKFHGLLADLNEPEAPRPDPFRTYGVGVRNFVTINSRLVCVFLALALMACL